MTHYAIWPEGQPEKAFATTSWWSSRWNLFRRQLKMLVDVRHARRMRMAVCAQGIPIPVLIEGALEDAGAIAPRDGWPPRTGLGEVMCNRPTGEVYTRTFSVV